MPKNEHSSRRQACGKTKYADRPDVINANNCQRNGTCHATQYTSYQERSNRYKPVSVDDSRLLAKLANPKIICVYLRLSAFICGCSIDYLFVSPTLRRGFWGRSNLFVSPKVRRGFKPPSHSQSRLKTTAECRIYQSSSRASHGRGQPVMNHRTLSPPPPLSPSPPRCSEEDFRYEAGNSIYSLPDCQESDKFDRPPNRKTQSFQCFHAFFTKLCKKIAEFCIKPPNRS